MPAAPEPANEDSRLRRLEKLNVLDTPQETFSDCVTTAAASIANTPIAAVSLIDAGRQWFKSSCGLPVRETSRDMAFCAHAILTAEPLVVADALADPRFDTNPLVVGAPHVRFYAGFPLIVDGQAIGTLCVIDDRPRTLTDAQVDQLSELADGAAAWFALRAEPAD